MAAVPFKAILKFQALGSGRTFNHLCTVSDVNGEYFIFEDGGSDTNLPGGEGKVALIDVVLSAAGTDTSQVKVFCNGTDTGVKLLNAACLGTNFSRQFMGAPMVMQPGTRLRLVQAT